MKFLAAGMLKIAGWEKKQPLVDPMCGTGTILIEAAMLACNMPSQLFRRDFCFKNWKDFNPTLWNRVKLDAEGQMRKRPLEIYGGDIDPAAVKMALQSLKKLGLDQQVRIRQADFEKQVPRVQSGMVITNPPYGERIEKDDIMAFYKTIGDVFKNNYAGFEAWVLSSNAEAFKQMRLKPEKKVMLYNGALECKFQQYELYDGSKQSADLPKEQ